MKHYGHNFYWIFPLFSGLCWLGTLLGLLLQWVTAGEPIYPSMTDGQTIAYISDTGAYKYKPLFIAGSCVTVVGLDIGLIAERWLRHEGTLARNTSAWQKAFSILSIIAAIVGAVGLILLSIFDTYRHPHLHDRFLVMFIVGYVVSALFICAEYQRLGVKYRQHPVLRASFWIKLAFIIVEVALAIPFGVLDDKSKNLNAAAILEWVVALVFTGYVLSFVMDLLPAVRSKQGVSNETVAEMGGYSGPNGYTDNYANNAYQPTTSDASGEYRAPMNSNF